MQLADRRLHSGHGRCAVGCASSLVQRRHPDWVGPTFGYGCDRDQPYSLRIFCGGVFAGGTQADRSVRAAVQRLSKAGFDAAADQVGGTGPARSALAPLVCSRTQVAIINKRTSDAKPKAAAMPPHHSAANHSHWSCFSVHAFMGGFAPEDIVAVADVDKYQR